MLSIFGILLSLALLMYLAYRGISVLILAPALALFAVGVSGELPLLATYTEVFMKNFASYAVGSSRVDLQACKLEYSIVSPK